MNIYENMKNKISDKIVEAFNAAVAAGKLPETEVNVSDMIKLEVPKDKQHGDFA